MAMSALLKYIGRLNGQSYFAQVTTTRQTDTIINGAEIKHMRSLICFALKEEAAPFRKIAAGNAASAQAGISILLTGIGRQNAEKSLREFLNSCRSRGDETQIKKEL